MIRHERAVRDVHPGRAAGAAHHRTAGHAQRRPCRRRCSVAARSRRSRSTASSRTARPPRWWPRAARSSGSACRGSIRPVSSARCSTVTPARSGSARPASACRPHAATCPGTMVLETSWGTGSGWIIVRDALLIGGWHHEDERSGTHRRAPTDYDADHVLLRTIRCVNGQVEIVMDCEPVFDYGTKQRALGVHRARATTTAWPPRPAPISGSGCAPTCGIGFEGPRATARHRMKEGEQLYCALYWSEHPPPQTFEEAYERQVWTAHHWQHWVDRGTFPDHPWRTHLQRSALTLKGLTYAPDRRADRGRDDLAAGDAAGRAQLGLPLQLDPRLDVHAVGALHARLRLGGQRLLLLHRRRRRRPRGPAGDVRARRRAATSRSRRSTTSAATRARGRCGSATTPTARRSTTSGARCSTPSTCTRARATRSTSASGRSSAARSRWRSRTGASPTAASGRSAASPSTSPRRRCSAGSPATAARAWPRSARTGTSPSAGRRPPTRSTPTSARTASTSAACSSSTTRPTRSTRRCC